MIFSYAKRLNKLTYKNITDTAGAVIDCEYTRDANKVIADLENKINTLLAATASV